MNPDQIQTVKAGGQRTSGAGVTDGVLGGVRDLGIAVAQEPTSGPLSHPRIRAAVATLGLTRRESQIVEKIAHGMGTQALAVDLFISPATVRTHLRKIFTKLDISSRVELISLVLAKIMEDLDGGETSRTAARIRSYSTANSV